MKLTYNEKQKLVLAKKRNEKLFSFSDKTADILNNIMLLYFKIGCTVKLTYSECVILANTNPTDKEIEQFFEIKRLTNLLYKSQLT